MELLPEIAFAFFVRPAAFRDSEMEKLKDINPTATRHSISLSVAAAHLVIRLKIAHNLVKPHMRVMVEYYRSNLVRTQAHL